MATNRHRGLEIAVWEAAAQGNHPADSSETYDSNGDRFHVVGDVDLAPAQDLLDDERSVDRIFERAGQKVKGLRNTPLSYSVYITGKDEVTADTSAATETALARLLEHCMGGITLGTSTTAKVAGSHSTTTIELTSTTGWAVGQVIGCIDADDSNSTVELRRIESISGDIVTVDQAFSFTPTDGDKVPATITITFDQDVLEDSGGAADRTHSIFVQKGASSTAVAEFLGCKAALSFTGLNRGELAQAVLSYQCASWRNSADTGSLGDDRDAISSTPAWSGTLNGDAPISMGPRTKVYLYDYGTTTAASVNASNIEINPGVEVTPIPSTTSATNNMEGLAGWSIGKPAPTASMQIVPHSDSYDTDLQAGTYKAFRLERQGAEGSSFCIGMPRCEVSATPKLDANGDVLATNISLMAHEDADAIGTTDLAKSPMYIGLC